MKTLILAALLAAPCSAMCGDCNDDGNVNSIDVLFAAQWAVGIYGPEAANGMLACDVAAPRWQASPYMPPVMTALDVLAVAQWAVGIGAPLVCS